MPLNYVVPTQRHIAVSNFIEGVFEGDLTGKPLYAIGHGNLVVTGPPSGVLDTFIVSTATS